jgi:multiple sugar transport system substrate-binding protein
MVVKRVLAFLMVLTLCLSLMVGCGKQQAPAESGKQQTQATKEESKTTGENPVEEKHEPVTIEFTSWGFANEATKPAYEAMKAEFESKYPWITVEMVGYPYNNVQEQLLIRQAGGTPPDVSQVAPIWVATLAEMDALIPIDELLGEDPIKDFYDTSVSGTTINGKLMSAPWTIAPVLMYYNKTLLNKAGFNGPPKTWAELNEMSKAIAALGKDADGNRIYGRTISSKQLFGAGYFFFIDMWQNGGEFLDENGNIVFNSEGTIKAFKEAAELMKTGVVASGLEIKDNRNLFALGQVGFHFDVAEIMSQFHMTSPKGEAFAEEYGAVRVPGVSGPDGISFSSDHHIVAFRDTENAEAVGLFIDWITGPEGMKIYTDIGVAMLPARKSASQNPFYATLSEHVQPFMDAIPVSRSLPVQNSNFISACEEIAGAIQRVCINNEDPEVVIPETEKIIKGLYGQ